MTTDHYTDKNDPPLPEEGLHTEWEPSKGGQGHISAREVLVVDCTILKDALEGVSNTGLFGPDICEAARRLIVRGYEELVRSGIVRRQC